MDSLAFLGAGPRRDGGHGWGPASKNAECRKPRASARLWGFDRGGWLAGGARLDGALNAWMDKAARRALFDGGAGG
jgi:hypothetical protein